MPQLQTPIDAVYTLAGGVAQVLADPRKAHVNLADGEPPMPWPWQPRMKLEGAMMFAHPGRERVLVDYLNSLPPRWL